MQGTTAYTFSRKLSQIRHLQSFIDADKISWRPSWAPFAIESGKDHFFIGWGKKPTTHKARQFARSKALPFIALEDGFLRSVGLGVTGAHQLSMVADDVGIYYDATQPSRLELILNGTDQEFTHTPTLQPLIKTLNSYKRDPLDDDALLNRAKSCIEQIIHHKLSKYNNSPAVNLGEKSKPRILLIDQTAGDASIEYGLASAESFAQMLECALKENPDADILIKTHPDVVSGKKSGHFSNASMHERVTIIQQDINPISLLEQADKVYVVSSQMGFEALMLCKPVVCFGVPFYAGWGLTDDRMPVERRNMKRSMEQVFAATYILYSRYIDPHSGMSTSIESVIDHLALQRHWFNQNSGNLHCSGFGIWKLGYAREFLYSPWNTIKFQSSSRIINDLKNREPGSDHKIVIWGRRDQQKLLEFAKQEEIPIWRVEDGFIRSVGLGSDLVAPASLVVDKQGIYFDPTAPSDLEQVLQETRFSESELARAKGLIKLVLASALSKYNIGHGETLSHSARPGQKIILVPGQVEDDASILFGCNVIRTNSALLTSVRASNPDAYIIFKTHPDIIYGNRKGNEEREIKENCDLLITHTSIIKCLEIVDEVHTMTSLVGFEALMRGLKVTTYGLPFYAGWGLTSDMLTSTRRHRSLSLEELVAGALIIYPRYMNPYSRSFDTPEHVINILEKMASVQNNTSSRRGWVRRRLFKLRQFFTGITWSLLQ
jgi:capsular polysaccharide export protein